MNYTQLRAFHHVALEGGFSRAAEALHLTQPAISDQVRKLEEQYDLLLFDRSKRQVRVTEKGKQLLEITHRLFDQEQQARDFLSETSQLNVGHLRLIVDSAYHVTAILSKFRRKYPKISISLRVGNSDDVISSLKAYEADVGVLGELPQATDLEILPLGASPLVAFAAIGTLFEDVRIQSYDDLLKYPLVLRETGSKTRQKLESSACAAGVELVPAIVTEGREAVREVVASGAGIGFVSAAEFGRDERLRQIPLPHPSPVMEEAMVCVRARKDLKVIKAFMAMAAAEPGRP